MNNVLKVVWVAGGQVKLAEQLGVTQQAVSAWARRGYVPLQRAREIEALFGVPRKNLIDPKIVEMLDEVDMEHLNQSSNTAYETSRND